MDLKGKEGLKEGLKERLRRLKGMGLRIDMTRGESSEERLDLSMGFLGVGLGFMLILGLTSFKSEEF